MLVLPCLPSLAVLLMIASTGTAGEDRQTADRLPETELLSVDGEPISLVAPKGGALAIVFLWTACPNSNQYSPTLISLDQEFPADRFQLVGLFVDADRSDAEVAAHAAEYGLEFPVGREGSLRLAKSLGVSTVPSAVLIDDRGQVRYLGRIDDQFYDLGRRRPVTRSRDLRDAILSVLAGEEVRHPRTEAIGCTLPDFGDQD